MQFLLCALGTAGDVYPFVGIGLEMQRRGHRVVLVTSSIHGPNIRRLGLDCSELGDTADYQSVYGDPDTWHARKGGRSAAHYFLRRTRGQYDAIAAHHVLGETILVAQGMSFAARLAQDKLKIPLLTAHVSPAFMLSTEQPPVMPFLRLSQRTPKWLVRAIIRVGDRYLSDKIFKESINSFRNELGLPPVRDIYGRWMHSPQGILGLYPAWFCPPPPDFPHCQVSEFPLFDAREAEPVPANLRAFLEAGEPPILFTTSTGMHDPRHDIQIAIEACRLLDRRGVLLASSPGQMPCALPDSVCDGRDTRFERVLPRAAAMVSHGGIGTTSRALRAGVPQLLLPVAHDAFDNADRFQRLGVARVLPHARQSARRVAHELERLLNEASVRQRCHELAARFPVEPLRMIGDRVEEFMARVARKAA